ncbi:hypothetical protein OHB54_02285 [Streptomyces sp. NBC_01007]|nr:hypothetical protein OHB54_02285 [Streptomyces sp. NBC_01007]
MVPPVDEHPGRGPDQQGADGDHDHQGGDSGGRVRPVGEYHGYDNPDWKLTEFRERPGAAMSESELALSVERHAPAPAVHA